MYKLLPILLLLSATASEANAQAEPQNTPVLKLAMYHSPPYYFTENVPQPTGLSLDLLRPAVNQLGWKIEIITCPFPRCLKLAEQGQVDIVSGLIKTAERERYLHFIEPAMMNFESSFVFYSRPEQSLSIHQVADLKGRTVAVMRNAVYFPEFDNASGFEKIPVNSESVALELVYKNRADYAILVEQTAAGSFDEANLQVADLKRQPYNATQNIRGYLAFSRQSPNFARAAQLELVLGQQYRTGMFHILWQKYQLPAIKAQTHKHAAAPLSATPTE